MDKVAKALFALQNYGGQVQDLAEIVEAEVERLQRAEEQRNQLYHHWRARAEGAKTEVERLRKELAEYQEAAPFNKQTLDELNEKFLKAEAALFEIREEAKAAMPSRYSNSENMSMVARIHKIVDGVLGG